MNALHGETIYNTCFQGNMYCILLHVVGIIKMYFIINTSTYFIIGMTKILFAFFILLLIKFKFILQESHELISYYSLLMKRTNTSI